MPSLFILAKVSEAALVVAVAGLGLIAPSPPGLGQYRFLRWVGIPDETVEEPADLGNRQRYQGFIPLRFSPLLPQQPALACCLITVR